MRIIKSFLIFLTISFVLGQDSTYTFTGAQVDSMLKWVEQGKLLKIKNEKLVNSLSLYKEREEMQDSLLIANRDIIEKSLQLVETYKRLDELNKIPFYRKPWFVAFETIGFIYLNSLILDNIR